MNNDALAKVIQQLSDKLGVTAQYLWAVLVRQARIELINDILSVVLTLIAIVFVVKWHRSIQRRIALHDGATSNDHYSASYDIGDFFDDNPFEIVLHIASIVVVIILIIMSIVTLFDIPTLIFNPQYWALHQLLK